LYEMHKLKQHMYLAQTSAPNMKPSQKSYIT